MENSLGDPRDQDPYDLMRKLDSQGISAQQVRRLLGAVLGQGDYDRQSWCKSGILPRRISDRFEALPVLAIDRVVSSRTDRFEKVLFRTFDQLPVETVIIPLHRPGAVTICLSSQVGCVMGCAFCATGRMTEQRNLKTWEIVDQLVQARRLVRNSQRRVSGIVFMGMGEPFLNYEAVLAAAELFRFPVHGAIRGKAITISTVGVVRQIDRFTAERHPFRLCISLGAATDEKRAQILPVASRTAVRELMAAARRHALTRKDRVMLAYVCIGGFNVSEDDAQALGDLIEDTPVRLDLIDVHDSSGRFYPPSPDEMAIFRDALTRYVRQPVVRRYSGGADINAACGTLAGI